MLFVVDFDGTLSVRDTVDAMLEQFADPSWEDVEKEWLDGHITAVQCMQKHGATPTTASRLLRQIAQPQLAHAKSWLRGTCYSCKSPCKANYLKAMPPCLH